MNKLNRNYLAQIVIIGITILTGCEREEEKVPVISSITVTNITVTTATSGGNITDEGSSTVTSRGVCWSTEPTPTIADNKTIDGAGAGSYSSSITGLFGGTTYFVRAYATNIAGTGYGMTLSFKTTGQPPSAPSVTAQNASNIQTNSAQLNGSVNANYYSTVIAFEYGTSTSYGTTTTPIQSPVTGSNNTNVNVNISGLTVGTTYHYRVKAVNSLGTTYSDDIAFKTLGQAPSATSRSATNITTISAQFNAIVNANHLSTTVSFEYGLTSGYGQTISATPSTVTGGTNTNVNVNISDLAIGTTYHYRVKAVNSLGTTYSDDIAFKTLGTVPTVSTNTTAIIATTGVTLSGNVNANHLSTTVSFEYGLTSGYGQTISATPSTVTGSTNTNVSSSITGLSEGTTYHYRLKAKNSLGTTYGSNMTFTTAPTSISDVDGNTYNVIAIGTQVWMAENLKTTKYNDYSDISLVADQTAWSKIYSDGLETPAYCWYNNDIANKSIHGALYNWYTVDGGTNGNKNVCPTGWHVPNDYEWTTLTDYLINNGYGFGGSGDDIAKSMASKSGWTTYGTLGTIGNDQASNNSIGFTALPSGERMSDGTFLFMGSGGVWSSSSAYSTNNIYIRYMRYDSGNVDRSYNMNKSYGLSIRCLRD